LLGDGEPRGDVTLEIRRGGRTARAALSDLGRLPRTIRGRDIPFLVHEEEARVASALLDVFTDRPHHLEMKGTAVLLVPVAACVAGGWLILARTDTAGPAAVALICGAVAAIGAWNAARLSAVGPLVIHVEEGVTVSLAAYAGLALAALWLGLLIVQRRRTS
jgi:hypothetical protein